jgi:hypothetical protein
MVFLEKDYSTTGLKKHINGKNMGIFGNKLMADFKK